MGERGRAIRATTFQSAKLVRIKTLMCAVFCREEGKCCFTTGRAAFSVKCFERKDNAGQNESAITVFCKMKTVFVLRMQCEIGMFRPTLLVGVRLLPLSCE